MKWLSFHKQLIFGAVASKEEHGYTIDLGIPDIMAFLKAEPEIDGRLVT